MKELDIKNIKKGDSFWENNVGYIALEDSHIVSYYLSNYPQWALNAKKISTNSNVYFLMTETLEHYGPFLYTKS